MTYILLALVTMTENYEDQKTIKKDLEWKTPTRSFGTGIENQFSQWKSQ